MISCLSVAEGDRTALGTVMRVWTERQIELRGVYNINLTGTALALVLSSKHPALDEIQARLLSCCLPHQAVVRPLASFIQPVSF